ncbi:universal stress protein [Streptomyces sp. NPDC054796]
MEIVAGVDGSGGGFAVAEWAACAAGSTACVLRLVHVTAPGSAASPWSGAPERMLNGLGTSLAARHPGLERKGQVLTGNAGPALADTADDETGLLVVGARGGGGFPGLLLGSAALATLKAATCPVALIRTGAPAPEPRGDSPAPEHPPVPARAYGSRSEVVLGVDAHAPDREAVGYAFAEAWRRGARLRAVHAWDPAARYDPWRPYAVPGEDRAVWEDEEVRALACALREWRRKYPRLQVLEDVRGFSPARALVHASEGADLLVVGRGADGLLGPAGDAVAHHARCPVIFVPRGPGG